MNDWTLLPNDEIDDEDPAAPEDDEDESSEEPDGDEDSDAEDEDSEEDDEEESPFAKDLAAQRELITDLRRSVGRSQSLVERYQKTNDELRTELRKQNESTAQILGAIVNGIDDSVIDPNLKRRVAEAQRQIQADADRESMKNEIRREIGYDPANAEAEQERAALQTQANELAADLEDQMGAMGIDPDEFDWNGLKEQFLNTDPRTARRWAMGKIREAVVAAQTATRRDTRRSTTKTPRGGETTKNENPLSGNDFAKKKAALDALLR